MSLKVKEGTFNNEGEKKKPMPKKPVTEGRSPHIPLAHTPYQQRCIRCGNYREPRTFPVCNTCQRRR